MKALVPAAIFLLVAGPAGPAQTPVRDQPRISSIGTASVKGSVVSDDETRGPLRRATLVLTRSGVEDMRTMATDDAGRFVYENLPAGTYTLSASKGAYISMSYGAPKPGMPGSSIVLTDGQAFVAKPIALMRGAVIAGRLMDQSGRPVTTTVRADQFVTVNGERRRRTTTGASGTSFANAHGDFRIYGLLPGDYVVSAAGVPQTMQAEATAGELAWARQPDGPPPSPPRSIVPAPTMFPGTVDPAAGVVVTLGRGEEHLGVDFALQYVPVARVTGTVLGTDGRPAPNAMVLCTIKSPSPVLPPSGVPISMTAGDGVFTCPGLAPGQYLLAARHVIDPAVRAGLPPTPGVMPLWGMVELTVTGRDVSNVTIQVQTGFSLSGQAEFKSVGTAALPDPSTVQVRLMQASTTLPVGVSAATLHADGTFQIDGIVPAAYRATVGSGALAGIPNGWSLRSVILNGRDIADVPVDVSGNLAGAVVTLTDAQTELSGVLADAAGKPAPQLYVFVFPADKTLWGSARRVQSVRSAENGSYRITGLPPGDYYLCALTELETTLQTEPSYLEQFVTSAIKITIGEGEKKVQSLRIGG